MAALGLQAEFFGDTTYVIKSVPALVSHVDPGALLREILDGLRGPVRTEAGRPVPQAVDDLLASMACKAAIKAGNRLQPVEMLKLLAQMAGEFGLFPLSPWPPGDQNLLCPGGGTMVPSPRRLKCPRASVIIDHSKNRNLLSCRNKYGNKQTMSLCLWPSVFRVL